MITFILGNTIPSYTMITITQSRKWKTFAVPLGNLKESPKKRKQSTWPRF